MVSATSPLRAALRGPLLLPLLFAPAPEGLRQETVAADPPDLRVFAASFNAANRVYDHSDADDRTEYEGVMNTILAGHDDPGGEADIVLLGFQEFEDDKYVLANELRESKLWTRQTTARLTALTSKAEKLMVPPDLVREAADALKREAASRHEAVESRVSEFQSKYGHSASEFFDAVASASPVNQLLSGAEAEAAKLREGVDSRMNAYGDAKGVAEDGQFKDLSAAASALRDFVSGLPGGGAETKSRMQPIRDWKNSIKGALNEFRADAPNLQFSDSGRGAWDAFMEGLDKDVEGRYAFQQNHHQRRLEDAVASFRDGVARRAREVEESVSRPVSLDWNRISEDLRKLQDDLKAPGEAPQSDRVALTAVQRHIGEEVAKVAGTQEQELQYTLQQWARGAVDEVAGLTETPAFPKMMKGFTEVRMEPQKYNSGIACATWKHYDTVLYAYVNPWSKWKIEPVDYSSETCLRRAQKSQKNMGCNIDNNMNGECGKVINLLVFEVKQGDVTQRFCAMNTHMSFAGEAKARMSFIGKAMWEAKAAGCQTAVFVGDFNSRLHCGKQLAAPPFDSSLDVLLDEFCTKSASSTSCSLKSAKASVQSWDELTQILSGNTVDCHEMKKSSWSKKGWALSSSDNFLRGLGFPFREADMPQFPPTYKLGNKTRAGDGWHRCVPASPDGKGLCFVNPDKKPKHNPAWTDRVLVRGDHFETLTYDRRMISETFGTDHAPVVAMIKFALG